MNLFVLGRFEVPRTWEKESRGLKPKSLKKRLEKVSRAQGPESLKKSLEKLFRDFFSDFRDPRPFRDFFETFWLRAPRLLFPGPRNLKGRFFLLKGMNLETKQYRLKCSIVLG